MKLLFLRADQLEKNYLIDHNSNWGMNYETWDLLHEFIIIVFQSIRMTS